jgi:hypothetical protein
VARRESASNSREGRPGRAGRKRQEEALSFRGEVAVQRHRWPPLPDTPETPAQAWAMRLHGTANVALTG